MLSIYRRIGSFAGARSDHGFRPQGRKRRIGNSNGIFAPVSTGAHLRNPAAWTPHRIFFAAADLSLLPAWCAARLAGGQPGGLPSSQPWHAGAAERHAPWGHGRGARRCWRVGHVKSGLFSLYSRPKRSWRSWRGSPDQVILEGFKGVHSSLM